MTHAFWADQENVKTYDPPTSAYREKTESELLSNGADFVVIHTTEMGIWYMFYEIVVEALRLYLPTTIKLQELLQTEERNPYVRMLEFIIREERLRANKFFVFCPTKTHAILARLFFSFIFERGGLGGDNVIELDAACAFYTVPDVNDNIVYRHEIFDMSFQRERKKQTLLERMDRYDNGQVVQIIRVHKQHEALLIDWQEQENEAIQTVKSVKEGESFWTNDPDFSSTPRQVPDYKFKSMIREIFASVGKEGEEEPISKKPRSLEMRFNKAFVDIFNTMCSEDVFYIPCDFIAYTTVGDPPVPDLMISFDYITTSDPSANQRLPVLYINYTVRMMQGMLYRMKNGTAHKEELPNLSNLFKSVLKFNKAEFGVDRLKIFHKTEGSTRMLTRDLSKEGENAGLKSLTPVTGAATYLTDFFKMDMRICSGIGCINLATHAFATDTQQVHGFCGRECAAAHFRKNKILP